MPTHAILDQRAPTELCEVIFKRGYVPILLPAHPFLPSPIASHPDMLLFFAADVIYTTKLYAQIAKEELNLISSITGRPICLCDRELSKGYENEISFNAVAIGKKLFCNPKHVARQILERSDYELCSTRQGYAKCSVIPISDNALITADPSIAKVAQEFGVDTLWVNKQGCELEGYDTGFIGGATSHSPYHPIRELYFCGCIDLHPQAEQIIKFCKEHDRIPISLTASPLLDTGTVFII